MSKKTAPAKSDKSKGFWYNFWHPKGSVNEPWFTHEELAEKLANDPDMQDVLKLLTVDNQPPDYSNNKNSSSGDK